MTSTAVSIVKSTTDMSTKPRQHNMNRLYTFMKKSQKTK